MSANGYQFALEFFTDKGSVAQVSVTPDWQPALESARFAGIRRGVLPPVAAGPGTIEPIWDGEVGAPYVAGIRALIPDSWAWDIPNAYFRGEARNAAARLLEQKIIQAGDTASYLVYAFAKDEPLSRDDADGLEVERVLEPLPLVDAPLERFLGRAVQNGDGHDDDMPVFIPQHVLDETVALARRTPDVETGGILIGMLHRDANRPEVFLEVTAQIPAEHARAERAKITFTAETWAAAQAAIDLRHKQETMLAWWHYHPDFCRNCPPENQERCALRSVFFSAEDVHLHRVCFAQPWAVALLLSDTSSADLAVSLFGWRQGMVAARGFHVMRGDYADAQTAIG